MACPQAHKLVVVAAGKHGHRPHPRRSRGAKPTTTSRRLLPGGRTQEESASSNGKCGCGGQQGRTATARLPIVSLTHCPASAEAKRLHHTTKARNPKLESQSTGALPVFPSLSSTITTTTSSSTAEGGGATPSGGISPPKGGPTRRRDFHSRFDERRHNGSDRPLRKQRIGCHGGWSTVEGGGGGGSGGGGPVKIWCCPSAASMREEACADLKGMDRPGLWRGPRHSSEELMVGYDQLDRLKERFKTGRKV